MNSPRIRLRSLASADLPQRLAITQSPEVQRGLTTFMPSSLELLKERFEQQSKGSRAKDFVIERIDDGAFLGIVCYYDLDLKNRSASMGLFLGERYQHQGYGYQAIALMLDFLFYEMGLHSVSAKACAFNTASLRLCEKVGFVIEGREREAFLRSGERHDVVLLGLLRREWENLSPPRDELPM